MRKKLIEELRQAIFEIAMTDVSGVQCAPGSTHLMSTCKISDKEYFLKFSEESNFRDIDPSLQILIEYLAYNIYSLYPNIKIPPAIHLVYDPQKNRVGIASLKVPGKMALPLSSKQELGKGLSAGVFVDIFLANWDAVGMGTGNVIVDKDDYTRIDPGGALTFRAQGGRKGGHFSDDAGELQTMLDPNFGGSGKVFQHSDLKMAAKTFLEVSWSDIQAKIQQVDALIKNEIALHQKENPRLFAQLSTHWNSDVQHVLAVLKKRYFKVGQQAQFVLSS
jgi:hypothetical protein